MSKRKLLLSDLTVGSVMCDRPLWTPDKGWHVKSAVVGYHEGETEADAQACAAAILASYEAHHAKEVARFSRPVASAPVVVPVVETTAPLACRECGRADFRTPKGMAWHVEHCAGVLVAA